MADNFSSRHLSVWILGLLLCLGGCEPRHSGMAVLDGEAITASRMAGRLVLINYWAEWCAPCRWEIPDLNTFHHENGDRVLVLGVNYDGVAGDALRQQVKKLGVEFPVLLADPGPDLGAEPLYILPTTLVLDTTGKLVKILTGPQRLETLHLLLEEFRVPSP